MKKIEVVSIVVVATLTEKRDYTHPIVQTVNAETSAVRTSIALIVTKTTIPSVRKGVVAKTHLVIQVKNKVGPEKCCYGCGMANHNSYSRNETYKFYNKDTKIPCIQTKIVKNFSDSVRQLTFL